jgi:superfamily II DNA helicase RecQ
MICGIDDSNVGVIIFVGLGYGLVNLYQGTGRSGRDGTTFMDYSSAIFKYLHGHSVKWIKR